MPFCLGAFALDLGFATLGVTSANAPQGPGAVLASSLGLRAAIDLCGLAIAGGLFIVPAFAAVQAWSGADHRARTIAAVNILNAAFMTGGDDSGGADAEIRRDRAGPVPVDRRGNARRGVRDLANDAEGLILLSHLQHAVDHLAGNAEIVGRIDQPSSFLRSACLLISLFSASRSISGRPVFTTSRQMS